MSVPDTAMPVPGSAASGPPPEPPGESPEERIVAEFPRMTRKQQAIARVLLEEHVDAAFSSAESLGRRADVDAATVVRFAQMIGFAGWVELRQAIRDDVPRLLTAAQKVSGAIGATSGSDDVMSEIVSHDIRNIREMAILNTPETLDRAVQAVIAARTVHIAGLGLESELANILALQLLRIGIPVRRVSLSLAASALDLASAGDADVIIALAVRRYPRDTVRMFEEACRLGARGIAMTDSKVSPLAHKADIVLMATDSAPRLSHSMTGMLSLVNVLVTGVTLAMPERSVRRLSQLDEMFDHMGAFYEPAKRPPARIPRPRRVEPEPPS